MFMMIRSKNLTVTAVGDRPGTRGLIILIVSWLSFIAGGNVAVRCAFAQYPVRVSGFGADAVTSWPIQIAQEKKFFAREGIQADLARSYNQMLALMGGSFDVITDGLSTTALALEKGTDIEIVYDLSRRPAEFLVVGRSIKTLADLEDKTVAVARIGTVPHLFLKKYLAENKVNVSKIRFTSSSGSLERHAALQNGQIAATLLSCAYAYRAQQEGMAIFTLAQDAEFPWAHVVVRQAWSQANAETVVRFLRSIHKATLWLHDPANFPEAVRVLTRVTGLDEKAITWSLQNSIEKRVHNVQRPNEQVFQSAINWLSAEGMLSKPINTAAAING